MGLAKWTLTNEEQDQYIDSLMEELAPLRAKAGISQGDLANLIGVSRQTYSAIEGRRKKMSWSSFLTLVFFFDNNLATRRTLRSLPAFPAALITRMNEGKSLDNILEKPGSGDLNDILKELDDQALHTLKTLLLVEYARCRKVPHDVVIRAFQESDSSDRCGDSVIGQVMEKIQKQV